MASRSKCTQHFPQVSFGGALPDFAPLIGVWGTFLFRVPEFLGRFILPYPPTPFAAPSVLWGHNQGLRGQDCGSWQNNLSKRRSQAGHGLGEASLRHGCDHWTCRWRG